VVARSIRGAGVGHHRGLTAEVLLEHVYRIAKSAFLPIGMSIGEPNRHFWRQIGIGIGFSAQNAEESADRHSHRLSELPINGRRQASRTFVLTGFSYLGQLRVLDHRSSS